MCAPIYELNSCCVWWASSLHSKNSFQTKQKTSSQLLFYSIDALYLFWMSRVKQFRGQISAKSLLQLKPSWEGPHRFLLSSHFLSASATRSLFNILYFMSTLKCQKKYNESGIARNPWTCFSDIQESNSSLASDCFILIDSSSEEFTPSELFIKTCKRIFNHFRGDF